MSDTEPTPTFAVSNKAYDMLRFIALVLLPAFGALYFGLADVLSLPAAAQVVGTITVVDTFLGVIIASLRRSYNGAVAEAANAPVEYDGTIVITPNEEGDADNLNVSLKPQSLVEKDEVVVRVQRS